MIKSFLAESSQLPITLVFPSTSQEPSPDREIIRVLVISSKRGVISTIHNLYSLGFAEVGEWSPLLPAPHTDEVMSILTRYIPIN